MRPDILNPLFAPVATLRGVGPKLEKAFTRLLRGPDAREPARVIDLVFHLPHAIVDRRRQPAIADAPEGVIVTLKVHVDRHQPAPRGNKRIPWRVHAHDETGEMVIVFFHAVAERIQRSLPVGETRYVSGRIELFNGIVNMVHPDLIVTPEEFPNLPLIEPVYPGGAGLSQRVIQKSVRAALERWPALPEWTQAGTLGKLGVPPIGEALAVLHQPRSAADLDPKTPARRRLAHDEYLARQLALALVRERVRRSPGVARIAAGRLAGAIRSAFGHPLTASQERAVAEINADLARPQRMLRLLQGDVGSGKTLVALLAMATVVEAGAQAALMAPTEVLARQHFATISPLCQAAGIRCALLTGSEKAAARRAALEGVLSGEIGILVGTHALLQGPVEFRELGLAVVDEQHRFGVHQRLALGEKGPACDLLVMTATPIPRTLVLSAFGDMDMSALKEKPAGRRPITTTAMPLERLGELVERVGQALAEGQKLYWICPLVEESEELPAISAEERFAFLDARFPGQVGLVHGRMAAAARDAAMESFRAGETRLLVATTVVEVGVDVPDATVMIVEHAERFGLSQLHQLRGRVGRGDRPSSCILLYKAPLGEIARQRLNILRHTEDGFRIAEEDLRLRGEGELLGTRQSGVPGSRLAQPEFHADLLEIARDEARLQVVTDPELAGPFGTPLRVLLYLFSQDQAVRHLRAG
jgi:ATP-dependent DNA helicase RecG